MVIAVTSNKKDFEGKVAGCFGKARYIFVAESEKRIVKIIDNKKFSTLKIGSGIKTAELLLKLKVQKVGVKEIQKEALEILKEGGVEVYTNVSGSVREVLDHLLTT